jgi:hypothetical protein
VDQEGRAGGQDEELGLSAPHRKLNPAGYNEGEIAKCGLAFRILEALRLHSNSSLKSSAKKCDLNHILDLKRSARNFTPGKASLLNL